MTEPVTSIYDNREVRVLWTKKFKAGYILQREAVDDLQFEAVGQESEPFELTVAYNHNGDYIGDSKWAYRLAHKFKAVPELAKPGNRTCSIAWSEKDQTWYGYSHRAIYGFKVGSTVKRGDCAYTPVDQIDYARELVQFFHNPEYHEDTWYELGRDFIPGMGYVAGVWIHSIYNDRCPNQQLHGTKRKHFYPNPEEWGRGEWAAETLEDAKEMAIAFAEDVS